MHLTTISYVYLTIVKLNFHSFHSEVNLFDMNNLPSYNIIGG